MPYWRLSSFYFFFYASLGAIVPYWGLYLSSINFTSTQIGIVMAVIMGTRIISPNIWGWLADRTGKRIAIVRLGSFFAFIAFAGVLLDQRFHWLLAVMLVFSFFWNAALPQFEALTLSHLGHKAHWYSRIRLWGSVGFILAVAGLGALLDVYAVAMLPYFVLALMAGIFLASMLAPEGPVTQFAAAQESLREILFKPHVLAFFITCLLAQASHGPYYTFYSLYLAGHGYSRTLIGQLWALGVIAEVVVFLVLHRFVPRLGLRKLLLISLFAGICRWLLIALFADNLSVLVVAQLLHAATFGIYHATSIQLIHGYFKGRNSGRGQALYSSITFGAGGALGSLTSGLLWSHVGATAIFYFAAMLSFLAWLIGWYKVRS